MFAAVECGQTYQFEARHFLPIQIFDILRLQVKHHEKPKDQDQAVADGVEFACKTCAKLVVICRSCWRGQGYCSDECHKLGQRKRRTANQRKYRQTKAGRENHIAQQKRYRLH